MDLFKEPQNCPTDLLDLHYKIRCENIDSKYRPHPGYSEEMVRALGYSPVGTHQIIIRHDDTHHGPTSISIIRGMASFGLFEVYGAGFDTVRFETEDEVVSFLKRRLRI